MFRRLLSMLGFKSTNTSIDIQADIEKRLQEKASGKERSVANESGKFSFGDARKPAQVFGAKSCPWSERSMGLLEKSGVEATYLDLDHPGSNQIREQLRAETSQQTVPYIYLRGQFIGGYDAIDEINRLGQLSYLVLPEAERLEHPDHGTINIAKRIT